MDKLKLHLDADISIKVVHRVLIKRGHDITRTPNNWMTLDASDKVQLLETTAQGRAIVTFNIGDFSRIAAQYPNHGGIILANQNNWTPSTLINALDNLMSSVDLNELIGQVRWLNDWR